MIPDRYRVVSGPNPGPGDGVLALLDVWLRRALQVVAGYAFLEDELVHGTLGDSGFASTPHGGRDAQNHRRVMDS